MLHMKSDPEVCSQRTRRAFTAVQREAILAEYDACENAADRAAVIRKHAIYSSHLANWRKPLANTKLLGPQKWTYYHLYVVLDVYSRYVVG